METRDTASRTIKSVETTFELLEAVLERDGAGVTELADALEMNKSTVHHHLATLEKHHFVSSENGEYRLGLGALVYGGHARQADDVFEMAKEDVDELARLTDETARLVVEHAGYGLTMYQSTGQNVTETSTHLGTMEHLHSTAAGKAFLAALPEAEVDAIIDERELTGFTPNTIRDRDQLGEELGRVRADGVAFDDCEQLADVRCVATTVTEESGELLGAISVSAPRERMENPRFRRELPRQMKRVCEVVHRVDDYEFRNKIPCISRTLPL
jgi:DNA-binding IclR family transcriptional regulator